MVKSNINEIKHIRNDIKVLDLMTKKPITINPEASVKEAAKIMQKYDVGSLIVVDKTNKLLGVITEQGLVHKVIVKNKDPEKTKIKEIMKTQIITIDKNKNIDYALKLLVDYNIRQIPVITSNKNLIGIITLKDILLIEPTLLDIALDKDKLKTNTKEGFCDICGRYSTNLVLHENKKMCNFCYENLN